MDCNCTDCGTFLFPFERKSVCYRSFPDDTKIHERIMLIDEPIIRMALLGEYHRIFTQANKEKKIKELQRQMDELKKS